MNMHRSQHPKSSVERVYLPRHLGGRGLLQVENLHDRSVLSTACRIMQGKDPLLQMVASHERADKGAFILKSAQKTAQCLGITLATGRKPTMDGRPIEELALHKISARVKNLQQWQLFEDHSSKPLHGQFSGYIEKLDRELSYSWLSSSGLRSETEGFIIAAQDGVLPVLNYTSKILGDSSSGSLCRACGTKQETIYHLLSACPSYLSNRFITRHDAALRVLYYHLRYNYGIDKIPIIP